MGDDKRPGGLDETVQAPNAVSTLREPSAAPVETIASEVANPVGHAATLAAENETSEDYGQLHTIDPKHYRLEKEIARGGMGRIFAARDRRLGRQVAIKQLLVKSSTLHARFEREARITARLQHPSIVSVLEAGTWPSGEPFYVMKLVSGQALDKVIADRRALDDRLSLLPNVIAAVDALAYAHSRSVIHRDLKPANVLVGEFGETVVIDWGLAKNLEDSTDTQDIDVGPYRSRVDVPDADTIAGSVIGTPGYMPIEQAIGKPVDERADVYSLGAMLYHLLASEPPYVGASAAEILSKVVDGPPPPIGDRVPAAPRELAAIIDKSMARDAVDRYRTAREISDDLKKFQTGQLVGAHEYTIWQLVRRWIRRHRTAVAVASVAMLVLIALGVVSVRRIVLEQSRAEENRVAAVDLMTFMLVDLHEKLQALGRLDLLADVAKKAVGYYERNKSEDAGISQARARLNLGDVLSDQGRLDDALHEYRAALAIAEERAAGDPMNVEGQRLRSKAHERLGNALSTQGATQAALVEHRKAQAIDEALIATEPTNARFKHYVAVGYLRIGDVLVTQGELVAAEAEFRKALLVAKELAAREPTNLEFQLTLVACHSELGRLLLIIHRVPESLAEYRIASTIVQAQAIKDPRNAVLQDRLSANHTHVGDALLSEQDTIGALLEYRRALTINEGLAARDPTNAIRQQSLAIDHARLGDALLAGLDTDAALVEYEASRMVSVALVAKDPTNVPWLRTLLDSHIKLGEALHVQGNPSAAVQEYRSALTIVERLRALAPTNSDFKYFAETVGVKTTESGLGVPASARQTLATFQARVSIADRFATSDLSNADRHHELSHWHARLALMLRAGGDLSGALSEYRRAMSIANTLATRDPTNAELAKLVTQLEQTIATCCAKP